MVFNFAFFDFMILNVANKETNALHKQKGKTLCTLAKDFFSK